MEVTPKTTQEEESEREQGQTDEPYKYKYLNDPVHGLIRIPEKHFKIIDTPIFQRLRDLKQLGGMYFVFPGASHNRFEHCVGTCYLAGKWMCHLRELHPELIKERDVELVEIAGLCHDLGHGPFSHTFEGVMKKLCENVGERFEEWEHENLSVELLRLINEEKGVLREEEFKKVAHMIRGEVWNDDSSKFLYRIVNNRVTSIDCDKFDYLARDCRSANLPLGFDFTRLIEFSELHKQSDGYEIVFRSKEAYNIYQMFSTRFSLHQQTYQHPVVKGVELMISDIFLMAKQYLALEDMIREKDYCYYAFLTDGVLREIERKHNRQELDRAKEEEETNNLVAAGSLIKRIRERDFYKLQAERKLLPGQKMPSMESLYKGSNENNTIQLVEVKIKFFASAGQPPFKSSLFTLPNLTSEAISSMIPTDLPSDTFLRLYTKTSGACVDLTFFENLDDNIFSPTKRPKENVRENASCAKDLLNKFQSGA